MLNREEELRFCKARRAAIALDYQNLNPEQRRAALATDGPLLLTWPFWRATSRTPIPPKRRSRSGCAG